MSTPSSPLGKERDWWSADLEGEMEKLEVEGSFFLSPQADPWILKGRQADAALEQLNK